MHKQSLKERLVNPNGTYKGMRGFRTGVPHTEETRRLISKIVRERIERGEKLNIGGLADCPKKICSVCNAEFKPVSGCQKVCFHCRLRTCIACNSSFVLKRASVLLIGKGKYCSKKCEQTKLKGHIPWNKGKGPLPITEKVRRLPEMKEWRKSIFARDAYTCVNCKRVGGKLHAHHIYQFHLILREENIRTLEEAEACIKLWEIGNGATLCVQCHKKIHKEYRKVDKALQDLVTEGKVEQKIENGIKYFRAFV